MMDVEARAARASRWAQAGLLTNACLALVKLLTGIAGNSTALIADAVESAADVFSSLIVWGGLRISVRSADEKYPFGYGKIEPLAAAVVSLTLLGAAVGIILQAARDIWTPGQVPAPYTLAVLLGVVVVKEVLFRRVSQVGQEVESLAVEADAWHHRSDALTSSAAAAGISIALVGGPQWAHADDWAAILASLVIFANGVRILRPAVHDLMDRSPDQSLIDQVAQAALAVPGVRDVEKLRVRRSGLGYFVDIHVQADPHLPLYRAHILSGKSKSAILEAVPQVLGVLVHMEPFEPEQGASGAGDQAPSEQEERGKTRPALK